MNKCEVCGKECIGKCCSGACRAKKSRRTVGTAHGQAHGVTVRPESVTVSPSVTKPKCETCKDTKQVGEEESLHGRSMGFKECPDCQTEKWSDAHAQLESWAEGNGTEYQQRMGTLNRQYTVLRSV